MTLAKRLDAAQYGRQSNISLAAETLADCCRRRQTDVADRGGFKAESLLGHITIKAS